MDKLDRTNKEMNPEGNPGASQKVDHAADRKPNPETKPELSPRMIPETDSEKGSMFGREIKLADLVRCLWEERRFFLKLSGAAIVVGLIVAFSIPKEYTTRVKLAPEMEDASKRMGNLGGLAAIAGINLNAATGSDALSPTLYPDVVQSTPFLLELFPVEVTYGSGKESVTLFDYIYAHQKSSWWSRILKLPFRAIGAVRRLLGETQKSSSKLDPFRLTEAQEGVLQALQNRISVAVDKTTLVISIYVEMQDPVVSAQVARVVVEQLQDHIAAYRTRKAKNDLAFTQKVFREAQEAYFKAQQAYAAFEDANRNLISASYRTEQERLRNEMTLAFNVYNTLAQKQEQDKLRVQEQTPVYTVIEPSTVPLRASSPQKALVLIGFLFLAFFTGLGWIVVRPWFGLYRRPRRPKEAE